MRVTLIFALLFALAASCAPGTLCAENANQAVLHGLLGDAQYNNLLNVRQTAGAQTARRMVLKRALLKRLLREVVNKKLARQQANAPNVVQNLNKKPGKKEMLKRLLRMALLKKMAREQRLSKKGMFDQESGGKGGVVEQRLYKNEHGGKGVALKRVLRAALLKKMLTEQRLKKMGMFDQGSGGKGGVVEKRIPARALVPAQSLKNKGGKSPGEPLKRVLRAALLKKMLTEQRLDKKEGGGKGGLATAQSLKGLKGSEHGKGVVLKQLLRTALKKAAEEVVAERVVAKEFE